MTTFLNNDGNIANALEVQNDNLEKVMGDGVQFITSIEIAQICEKEHVHVMRDIRRMLEDLGEEFHYPNLDSENFGEKGWIKTTYKNSRNQEQPMYLLDKNLSLTLVAGYSTILRNRIINRWLELERKEKEQQTPLTPNIENALSDPGSLRGLLLNYVEKVIALQEDVKKRDEYICDIEPQAEAFEKIGSTDETFTITQASKILDLGRKFLIKFLETERWIYRQNGKLTPMKEKKDQKLLTLKFHELGNGYSHIYITSKGLQKITLLITRKYPSLNFRKYQRGE